MYICMYYPLTRDRHVYVAQKLYELLRCRTFGQGAGVGS